MHVDALTRSGDVTALISEKRTTLYLGIVTGWGPGEVVWDRDAWTGRAVLCVATAGASWDWVGSATASCGLEGDLQI